MSVGGIVMMTTAVIWLILQNPPTPIARLMPTAGPLPTAPPATAVPETNQDVALLPETPLDPEYPEHFVSALDAAVPNSGQPVRIVIPIIGLDAPIQSIGMQAVQMNADIFYQWQVPQRFAAGWHNTSARLGSVGNTVLNGHHNIYGEVFRDLVDLEAGDTITVYGPDNEFHYQVNDVMILPEQGQPLSVRRENAAWITTTTDERLTLVTCWPYEDNTHRVVVVAYPVAADELNQGGFE